MNTNHIPLDKSWVIRCLALDICNGYDDAYRILGEEVLSDDIQHALKVCINWKNYSRHFVGESATLLRFLRFINWRQGTKKSFRISGTLKDRKICNDKSIINLPFTKLLKLDKNTSQWASASYICGNRNDLPERIPFKLQTTIDACKHWEEKRNKDLSWEVVKDETILNQCKIFLALMKKKKPDWFPLQSEDYCFARVFEFIEPSKGSELWPTLVNHETNRISEMESAIDLFENTGQLFLKTIV